MMRLLLVLLLFVGFANAADVYKCQVDGRTTYQDKPCAGAEVVPIRNDRPTHGLYLPKYEAPVAAPAPAVRVVITQPQARPQSFRCITSTGEVFYRHDGCPPALQSTQRVTYLNGRSEDVPIYQPVQSVAIDRGEACNAMEAHDFRRKGRDRDQRTSTYDKNAGRDVCQ